MGLGNQTLVVPNGNVARGNDIERARQTAKVLFGPDMHVTENRTVDLDYYQGNPMSAKGLAVAIAGSASVVNVGVAEAVTTYQ